jgi:aspartate aminotransferase
VIAFRPEIVNVPESPLVQIATAAEAMPGAIKLCYGESDTPTPAFICRAASDAMSAGHTFYTHTAGYAALRDAIAAKVFELHGVRYRQSEIMCTVGASMAIFTAIRACIGPGDNALVITPTYGIFANAIRIAGGEPRPVPLARDGDRFRLDVDRVDRMVDGATRMLIVNSPSNPTGWTMTNEDQRAICELAERHDLMILADEVYERIVFDASIAPSIARVAQNRDRIIVVNSFSKTYDMTGWRLGWAQGSERLIRLMYSAAEFITSNPAAMAQQAGIVALRDGEPYVTQLRARYTARRKQVAGALAGVPRVSYGEPEGGFYAFPRIEGLKDSTAFTADLLRETGVALAPGRAFGDHGEGYVRMCFAVSEPVLAQALDRFSTFVLEWGQL